MTGDIPGPHAGQVIPWPGRARRSAARPSSCEADAEAERASVERARRRRAVWLRDCGVAAVGYLIDGGFIGFLAATGAVHWSAPWLYALPGWLTCAAAAGLIASGHSQNWQDPAVSDAQAFSGMAICGLGIVAYPEISFLYMLILSTVFLSATYTMSRRRMGLSCCGVSALIAVATLGIDRPFQVPGATAGSQVLVAAGCAAALTRGVLLSAINGARARLLKSRDRQVADILAHIEQLTNLDELTGLPNRRNVLRTLDEDLARSASEGTALAVAWLCLDHLKAINNTCGHPAGDRTLQAFAAAVLAHQRDRDRFGRLGGGEFLLILPVSSPDDAHQAVESLRDAVASNQRNTAAPDLHLTFSAGVAAWQAGETAEQLLSRAENSLRGAQHADRNRSQAG